MCHPRIIVLRTSIEDQKRKKRRKKIHIQISNCIFTYNSFSIIFRIFKKMQRMTFLRYEVNSKIET